MAKKGGVQQLQADVQTDEEFEKFVDRPGLLVIDVYSEWCGPCLGMVGSLKKIKLELGGDNLQLAICKADHITALTRFREKSEPSWLFVTGGKAVNLMFGTNVPKLMQMIATELTLLDAKNRKFYDITEMQPEEVERMQVFQKAEDEAKRAEAAEEERKRREYLLYVTDAIMETLPDMGVTLFGPQVHRDMFKRLMDPADTHKIQCKDRRVVTVTPEDFETICFDSDRSRHLDPEVIDQMCKKELLVCFWKISEEDQRSMFEIFNAYAHDLTKSQPVYDENGELDPEVVLPPIVKAMEVKILPDVERPAEKEEEVVAPAQPATPDEDQLDDDMGEILGEGPLPGASEEEGKEGSEQRPSGESQPSQDESDPIAALIETAEEALEEEEPEEQDFTKIILVPPIWIPDTKRAHAAAVYVFFRQQTLTFLPPDPPPEPPHLVMAFDAYKKKDILEVTRKFAEDVLLYGYFSSDDPVATDLIANSTAKYDKKPHQVTDKLVLKVSKKTSHCVLTLATHNPCYVSPNTVVGKKEALSFFPEGYKTGEMEELEGEDEEGKEKKKKKKKKKKDGEGSDATLVGAEGAQQAAESGEAVTPTEESEEGEGGEGGSDEEKPSPTDEQPPEASGDAVAEAPAAEG